MPFTVGYGGRPPRELVELLTGNGIRTVIDVRLRPQNASMGAYVLAKTPDKGVQLLLAQAGIGYRAFVELGNLFLDFPDWRARYRQLLDLAGPLLVQRLSGVPEPYCLMCAEKLADDCHRRDLADYLTRTKGLAFTHLE